MLIQSLSGHCFRSRLVPGLHSRSRQLTAGFSPRRRVSLSRWDFRWSLLVYTKPSPDPISITSLERSEAMRLSVLHLAWLLGLMFLVGLSGCGPAPSDEAANVEPHARVGGLSESQTVSQNSPSIHRDPVTSAASPSLLASGRSPAGPSQVRPAEPFVVPAWIATALKSPDVHVRLHALDRWGQHASAGSVDPLILAMEGEDERVQARALALIEQDWVRAQAEEK